MPIEEGCLEYKRQGRNKLLVSYMAAMSLQLVWLNRLLRQIVQLVEHESPSSANITHIQHENPITNKTLI